MVTRSIRRGPTGSVRGVLSREPPHHLFFLLALGSGQWSLLTATSWFQLPMFKQTMHLYARFIFMFVDSVQLFLVVCLGNSRLDLTK